MQAVPSVVHPDKKRAILMAGKKQLSTAEFEELLQLFFDLEVFGITPWINTQLGTLMSKLDWELEIEPSPEWDDALQACDYAFSGKQLQRMCREHGLSPVGHKKELCQRLYEEEIPEVVAIMAPYYGEEGPLTRESGPAKRRDEPVPGEVPPGAAENVYHVPQWPEVRGVFVGGCVARGPGSRFRAKAHAHNFKSDPHFGWICFLSLKRVGEVEGKTITNPSAVLWHEYTHILTPNHYHDDVWRAKMKELGQPITERYKKKPRR